MFPATRSVAKLVKLGKRASLSLGLNGQSCKAPQTSSIDSFLESKTDSIDIQLLLGTPGPSQKATIRIVDSLSGQVTCFIKYAPEAIVNNRLGQEYEILKILGEGMGPKAIKFGELGKGQGLMIEPLDGVQPKTDLPPNELVISFLKSLMNSKVRSFSDHPIWTELKDYSAIEDCRETICQKEWTSCTLHGDFAPWNIRIDGDSIKAFDWEYGRIDFLPFVDLSFYIQQVGALIYKWSPREAFDSSVSNLRSIFPSLTEQESIAFTRLTAMWSYNEAVTDGHPPEFFIQPWRRNIWEIDG